MCASFFSVKKHILPCEEVSGSGKEKKLHVRKILFSNYVPHMNSIVKLTYIIICLHIHTFDGESGLHASTDVVSHVTVEEPSPWVSGHHFHSLESPGEEVKDVCTVHVVRLAYMQCSYSKRDTGCRGKQRFLMYHAQNNSFII